MRVAVNTNLSAHTENPVRILVADDDTAVRESVGAYLRCYGCTVLEAADGQAALEVIDREPLDALVTDIRMPYFDGWSVARRARERSSGMPVVYMSGMESAGEPVQGSQLFSKPFPLIELVHALRVR